MCVHAHPDDESSKGAATMAHYVTGGDRVLVASCTGGERGDVLNPRLKDDPDVLRDLPALPADWFRLWRVDADGRYCLTSAGQQADLEHRKAA